MTSKQAVAVLGAGPMGLAVAYQLIKDGKRPIVFEADSRVGGMTASFDFNGLQIERYYHFHCTSDLGFVQVLQELGLEKKLHWVETKMAYYYQGRIHPWGNPIALLKFSGLGLVAKVRAGLFLFLATKRNDWRALDKLEATAWMKRWMGQEAYAVLWQKLFDYKFYDYAQQLSAAWIWARIRRLGRSRYSLFREKLGYLEGGSKVLMEAMADYITAHGGEIRLQSPVQKVVIEDGRVTGLQMGDSFMPFAQVVSTVPLPYVPRLIPDLPSAVLSKLQALRNIAVVCVIVKLRKPVSEYFWMNVNDPDMDIPGIVEYTNLRPLDNHIVYVPYYMPGEHPKYAEPDEVFTAKVKRYLMTINKTLVDEDFIDIRANRYRFAQPVCGPGFMDQLPPVQLPVGGLLVADTSYYYPEDRGISESIDFGKKMARLIS
ncbi:MAG TPA: NAD(P)/FAD-dependent oxidoreductase [Spongiibacteraceae bacterium]|nr:NAD(P)/FAD-dependent oxidoreductase [Spongiibacteraceae bacterium]